MEEKHTAPQYASAEELLDFLVKSGKLDLEKAEEELKRSQIQKSTIGMKYIKYTKYTKEGLSCLQIMQPLTTPRSVVPGRKL